MKNGIIVLLSSFLFTAIGSLLKLQHFGIAEIFLILGVTTFVIAMVMILRQLFRTK